MYSGRTIITYMRHLRVHRTFLLQTIDRLGLETPQYYGLRKGERRKNSAGFPKTGWTDSPEQAMKEAEGGMRRYMLIRTPKENYEIQVELRP